jgi:ATP-dependent DNA helicase RecQ
VLRYYPGTGIIYTATKHSAEMVAAFLVKQGIHADYYHAGREDDMRQDIEQKLMSNQYKVVCSTNALGMGIDKPDVRFIMHYQIPASPIHYYQEMGRAGRDNRVAWCILLYDPADLTIQEYFIRKARPEGKSYEMILSLLRMHPQGLPESKIMLTTGLAQNVTRTILADLAEQRFVERNLQSRMYTAVSRLGQMDFSDYDEVRQQKLQELSNIQNYVQCDTCLMVFLTTYLGDEPGDCCRQCGRCQKTNFPPVTSTRRIQEDVAYFLEEDFLPCIEKRAEYEAGWSLSFHGNSKTGRLVRGSKYEEAGPFALSLVNRAVKLVRTRYPIKTIDGIVSVPPTRSGLLVEMFARQVAAQLGIEYLTLLEKVRPTQEQKLMTNWRQKVDNVKGAFCVSSPELVNGRTLLLIDDIYDSGYMLREVGHTLMQAGASLVYPLTITRTAHSDDQ